MRHRTRRAGGVALLAVAIAASAARAEEAPLAVPRTATGAASAAATASVAILDRPAILRTAEIAEWRADAPPSPHWPVDARASRRSCPASVTDCPQLVIDLP